MRQGLRTWCTSLSSYWNYKAVQGSPPGKKTVSGPLLLEKVGSGREQRGNNAMLWHFNTTVPRSSQSRAPLCREDRRHRQCINSFWCLRVKITNQFLEADSIYSQSLLSSSIKSLRSAEFLQINFRYQKAKRHGLGSDRPYSNTKTHRSANAARHLRRAPRNICTHSKC